jgi:hypothetical protein
MITFWKWPSTSWLIYITQNDIPKTPTNGTTLAFVGCIFSTKGGF